MRLKRVVFAISSLVVCSLAADQDILTILKQQDGISTFTAMLEQFQDLVDILNQDTFSGKVMQVLWWTDADKSQFLCPMTKPSLPSATRIQI